MPVYNGEKYLNEAIESVLNQTFKEYEFLIIDSDSQDKSVEIIREYKDSRIQLIVDNEKLNLAETLNWGLKLARGKYIARMDCDDICLPNRLEKQYEFMEKNLEVGVCGSWINQIGEGVNGISKLPVDQDEIACKLLFANIVAHPTIMFRKQFLDKHNIRYSPKFKAAEDYELWSKCVKLTRIAVIPEALLFYRVHKGNASKLRRNDQKRAIEEIVKYQLSQFGADISDQDILIHQQLSTNSYKASRESIAIIEKWLIKLLSVNGTKRIYSDHVLSKTICETWIKVCYKSVGLGTWILIKFWSSQIWEKTYTSLYQKIMIILRYLVYYIRRFASARFKQKDSK
jgi:glycosyltransferase involved in cell wall biosynthesis